MIEIQYIMDDCMASTILLLLLELCKSMLQTVKKLSLLYQLPLFCLHCL